MDLTWLRLEKSCDLDSVWTGLVLDLDLGSYTLVLGLTSLIWSWKVVVLDLTWLRIEKFSLDFIWSKLGKLLTWAWS